MSVRVSRSNRVAQPASPGIRAPGLQKLSLNKGVRYVKAPTPKVIETFEVNDFTSGGAAHSQSIDTTRKFEGSGALLMGGMGVSGSQFITKAGARPGPYDPMAMGTAVVRVDYGTDAANQSVSSVSAYLGRSNSYSAAKVLDSGITQKDTGSRWLYFRPDEITPWNGLGPGSLDFRFGVGQSRFYGGDVTFDAFAYDAAGEGTVIFAFDDIHASQYDFLFPRFKERGLRGGTIFLPWKNQGKPAGDGTTRLVDEKIYEMSAWGFDVAVDGTEDDTSMLTRDNPAACIAELGEGRTYITGRFPNIDLNSMVFPNAAVQNPGTTVTKTGVISVAGNNSLTVSDTTGLTENMRYCSYAQSGSVVRRIISISGTTVTLDGPVTRSGTYPADFVDDSDPFYYGQLQNALAAAGFTMCRGTGTPASAPIYTRYEMGGTSRQRYFPNMSVSNNETLANIYAAIEATRTYGLTLCILLHGSSPTGDTLLFPSDTKSVAILDYVYNYTRQGLLRNLTFKQLAARDLNRVWLT